MKVYCEHGAITSGLHRLQRDGRIEIVQLPYERQTRRAAEADPSEAGGADAGQAASDEIEFAQGDSTDSDMYSEIERIIGRANDKDIRHVYSAYKSGCDCFFTTDKRDILSRRAALEELLGIAFFHPQEDWRAFLTILRRHESECGGE